MGQLERAMNRIYGIEKDRPFKEKYSRALAPRSERRPRHRAWRSCCSRSGAGLVDDGTLRSIWLVLRWPVGIALVGVGLAVLFRWSPARRQPGWAWLAFGATVSVVAWTLTTAALALVFGYAETFGETYGSLAGLVGAAALDVLLGARDPLRRRGRRAARGDSGRPRVRSGTSEGEEAAVVTDAVSA